MATTSDLSVTRLDALAANATKYIVSPLNAFGLGGFVFDIEGETSVTLQTEITDHFVEDGTTIQDHIAVKPKKVTLRSYVGELVYRQDKTTDTPVQKVVRKLTTVSAYLPEITAIAQQALNVRALADLDLDSISLGKFTKTVNRTTDLWAFVKNMLNSSTRQEQAYQYFKALMETKQLVSLQTPFEFMNRMAIESITSVQGERSKFIGDFSITLKEIRTAEVLGFSEGKVSKSTDARSVQEQIEAMQGRSSIQYSIEKNQGNIPGTEDFPVLDVVLPLEVD
jgi:hypothetical protein